MIIEQLSIFLNNAVGRLSEVTSVLAAGDINLRAFTLSESSDFGILRLITDDNDKAASLLKQHGFAVNRTKVVLIELGDTPGALSKCVAMVSNAGISVEYMYAFSKGTVAYVVIRTEDIDMLDRMFSE